MAYEAIAAGLQFASSLESIRLGQIGGHLDERLGKLAKKGALRRLAALPQQRELAFGEIDRAEESLGLMFGNAKSQLEYQRTVQGLERGKQRVQEAQATGNIGLARSEATKVARVESEQYRFMHAATGASAFTRSFNQMSVNKMSTLDQQTQALEKEKLFNRQAFSAQEKMMMNQAGFLQDKFDLEMRGAAALREKTALDFELRGADLQDALKAAIAKKKAGKASKNYLGISGADWGKLGSLI